MATPRLSYSKVVSVIATVTMETTAKKLKTRNNINEEALRDWLVSMGAGQDVMQDKVLKPASLGALSQLWKQITQQIIPANKCKQIKDNIFLAAVNNGNNPACIQITLQNRKKELEEQRDLLQYKQKQKEEKLRLALQNTVDNKTKLELVKQKLINMRRKRALLEEFKEQIKLDIKHSENVSENLSLFSKNDVQNNHIYKFNNYVENDVKNLNMAEFWESLISKRQEIVNLFMKMATSVDLPKEFAVVEKNCLEKYNAKCWKDGIVDLNLIFIKIVFSTLKFKKDIQRLNVEKLRLLKSKLNFNKITEDQKELLQLHLQINSLKQNIASQKDFIRSLRDNEYVFSLNLENNFDCNVEIADVTQEIVHFQKLLEETEESIKINMMNIVEGIPVMKDIRSKVLDILGRDNSANLDCSNRLANLFESVLSSNSSKRMENASLIDIKDKFIDLNISDCIEKQHKALVDEVKFLNEFNLEANRKLIFNNGAEIWFSETDAGRQIPCVDEINNLLPPFQNSSSLIKKYLNMKKWESNLEKLQTDFENTEQIEKEKSEDINATIVDDVSASDIIKKMAKSTIKSLQHVQDLCSRFDEKVKFFNEVKWKNYVSKQRTHNGMNYIEYEEKYKEIIRDMN